MTAQPTPGRSSSRVVTPELALVSPELAETARANLPERPWKERGGALHDGPVVNSRAGSREAGRQRKVRIGRIVAVAAGSVVAAAVLLSWQLLGRGDPGMARSKQDVTEDARQPSKALLTPQGGYVVFPKGSLTADRAGKEIETFELPVGCRSGPVMIRDIPVMAGSFAFSGTTNDGRIAIRVTGRVLSPDRLRGRVVVEGAGCSAQPVAFSARLS